MTEGVVEEGSVCSTTPEVLSTEEIVEEEDGTIVA